MLGRQLCIPTIWDYNCAISKWYGGARSMLHRFGTNVSCCSYYKTMLIEKGAMHSWK